MIKLEDRNIRLAKLSMQLEDISGYYNFSGISSSLITNCGTLTDSGILTSQDTILIKPLLTVNYSSVIDDEKSIPDVILYEYSFEQADFVFYDSIKYSDGNYFRFIPKNKGVNYLFGKIVLPKGNSNLIFEQMLPIIVLDKSVNKSNDGQKLDVDQLFEKFISFVNKSK
ncbi:MAG: hypothetical protein A2W85_14375 [Bacteroidetes bacterium GWF2_41_31]|nr:MAG: hypothetical protein A2W85_14375 [Bacteroidetes bacterium GWF2_41_31]